MLYRGYNKFRFYNRGGGGPCLDQSYQSNKLLSRQLEAGKLASGYPPVSVALVL